jgi:hypothetical protein
LPPWPALACYVAAAGVLAAGYVFDESTCLWYLLTGRPCPGCGMIHACLAIARGDLRSAWTLNRASFVVFPILLRTVIREIKELAT